MEICPEILFENESVIVAIKPEGVILASDPHTGQGDTLLKAIKHYCGGNLWIINKIDRSTPGIVLFARNTEVQSFLTNQFDSQEAKTKYLALVSGIILVDEGSISKPIRSRDLNVVIHKGGREALTLYKVLERFRNFTLVEVQPKTFIRHQIRIHMRSIGFPLAIDSLYNNTKEILLSEIKRNYKPGNFDEKPLLKRMSLFPQKIIFTDPLTKNVIEVEAPVPDDFKLLLKQLRKFNS